MQGHLRQRGKKWYLVFDMGRDATGKRHQRWQPLDAKTKREAEKEQAGLIHKLNTGELVEPSKMTVAAYLDKWLETAARPKLTKRSFDRYSDIVRLYLVPHVGGQLLTKLAPMHIQECYAALLRDGRGRSPGGLSPQTVRGAHVVLHAAMRQAVKWQMLMRNPADAVESPRAKSPEAAALDESDAMQILAATKGGLLYIPTLLAVMTGMRRGEILALKWREVDLTKGMLTVNKALEESRAGLDVKEPKTYHGRRTITLPSLAVEELKAYKREQAQRRLLLGPGYTDQDLVCENGTGGIYRPVNFSMHFMRFVARHQLPKVKFHELRHSHASQLLKAGVPAKVVQERLGHANINITLGIYGHVLPGMQEDAALRIDAALREARDTLPTERAAPRPAKTDIGKKQAR